MDEQTTSTTTESATRKPRGIAAMTPEQRRAFASLGGKAAHAAGTAHEFTREEARAAGSKGGAVSAAKPGHMKEIGRRGGIVVSADREHMAELGRKGGSVVASREGHMSEIGRRGGVARAARAQGDEA